MRILILNDLGTPSGGAEQMTVELRDELQKRGHEVRILTSRSGQSESSFADVTFFGSSTAVGTLLKTANPFAAWTLRKTLQSFQPDVVHIRMFMTQLSPLILPILKHFPTIYHTVSYETLCPTVNNVLPDGSFCQKNSGWICHRSGCLSPQACISTMIQKKLFTRWKDAFDLVVANGTLLAEHLKANNFPRIEVIPNGISTESPRPPLADPPTITYIGRLVFIKGIDVLLKAFQTVIEAVPNARLLIAGDGPEAENLKHMAKQLGLEQHVTWLGRLKRQQIAKQFANSWVHACPSRVETFGISATEAMMRATTVVAARTGGLIDQVKHGTTGYLFPSEDNVAMAKAIIPLLQNRALCEQMGAAARQRAIKHFTIESCANQFEQVYERLLSDKENASRV